MVSKARIGCAAVLAALVSVCAHTTPMRFDRLGLDEGLAQLAANAIAQDATGFIWVGTEEGLDRYDGHGFQHWRHDRADPTSLSNDFVGDLAVDPQGNLWVATDGGGVVRRDARSGAFHPIAAGGGLERARVLQLDRWGRLWIGSRNAGVAMYEPRSRRLVRFRHDPANVHSLSSDAAFALFEDRHGSIWIGTAAGIDRLTAGLIERVLSSAAGAPLEVRALLEDRLGAIWAGTSQGLARLDPSSGEARWFRHEAANIRSLPQGQVNTLLQDHHGRLWVGTDGGLALFDGDRGTFDVYRHDPADPASLPDDQVMSLHEDRSGLLWVGTKFGGLAKWNPRTWSFGPQPAGNVMAFTEDRRRRLWIGSIGGGLTRLDRRTGRAERIKNLSDERVMALLTDGSGAVWAGTMGGGLNRIDPESLHVTVFSHDPKDPHSLSAPGVMSLFEDSAGRVWAGTYGGALARYDRATARFTRYGADPANPAMLESDRITALAGDRHGWLWVGTDGGGLHILDPASGRVFRLPHAQDDLEALSSDTVYALHVDGDGTVWVGTRGGGLDRVVGSSLQPEAIRFRNYSERDGLPNNTVYGIRGDAQGKLWLSTNRGLARLDPASGAVRAFHRDHGLQGEEFNFGAHYVNAAGELFFGGPNGYNAFDPRRLRVNSMPPPVVLTAALQDGRPVAGPLQLDARDGAITFEFAALDFAAPRANRFQYRLEGLDTRWSAPTLQRNVSYTNLDGGHYTLRARAANADGVWNEVGFALAFDVRPPPWKSGWAFMGYAASFALLLWLAWVAHRRRIEREVRYSRRLESEVRRRTRELEQMSFSDPLTGLGNRRSLIRAMPDIIATTSASRLALMVVDLDNLKPINDEHGHEVGDRVLARTSAILQQCLGEQDRAVRWGGDEFVIVKTGVGMDEAAALAERIRAAFAAERFGRRDARTSCSIGFALFPFIPGASESLTWEQVLNLADIALYRAKSRRDAWFGWQGRAEAAHAPDLTTALAAEMSSVENNYVESRSSASLMADDRLNAAI